MFKQYRGLRRELYVLFIGRVMTNFGGMIMPMLTLILSKKLGMNASNVADYLLVFSLLSIPASLIAGKLADKYNKRNIIIVCDLISVISYIYCGLSELTASSIYILQIAAVFQTMERPAYDTLVADFTLPKDRERAYSLSYFGANLGLILSPTIGGFLFNDYLWLAFIINGVAILFSTVLIFFLIKDIHREESDEDINEYEVELDNSTNSLKYIFTNRVLSLFLFARVLSEAVYSEFNYLMPLDLSFQYSDAGSVIFGSLTSVNCITVVLFTTILTKYMSKVFETNKMMIGTGLTLLGLVIFRLLLTSIPSSYVAMFIFTLGEIISSIGLNPFITKRIPANYRGRISSILNVCCDIFVALFNKLEGIIYDSAGSLNSWMLVYGIGIVSLVLFFTIIKADKKTYKGLYK